MMQTGFLASNLTLPLLLGSYVDFLTRNVSDIVQMFLQHVDIIVQAIAIAVPIGVALGVVITYDDRVATVVLWLAGIMMTIPSIALFGLLIPYLGIGVTPVVFALVLYSQLPIVRNTYVGLTQVDPAAVEAGTALGMTRRQRLWRVQLPVALPVIMTGVRNAVVLLIGIAAIGAFIGGGGLGNMIFNGISGANTPMIVVGTIVLSLLALAFDYGFGVLEQLFRLRNGEELDAALVTRLLRRSNHD